MRFTEASVKAYLPPDGKPSYSLWDENLPGFGFRVQNGGSKVYYAKYRLGSKQRMLKIGRADKLSLADATKKAKAVFSAVADNVDPANTKAKAGIDANLTFGKTVIDAFLAQLESDGRSKGYVGQNRMYLYTHFKALHGMALSAIDKETVGRELKIINKRGKVTMNRARSSLSAFFGWAIKEYNGIDNNPAEQTNKNEEKPRDRILSPSEMKTIWDKAPQDQFGDIVRLLMLTMQRRTEIGGMPTSEFKHNARQIEIDGSRTKNGKGSIIPLSDAAFDILNKHYDPDRKFMFGDADTGYQGWSKSKEELDAIVKIDKHWIFHDFRRTGKTAMEDDLDVPDKVSEAILNHAKKGLDKVYNGAKYVRQKREALVLYAAHVMKIVAIDDAASQDDAA